MTVSPELLFLLKSIKTDLVRASKIAITDGRMSLASVLLDESTDMAVRISDLEEIAKI